MTHYLSQKIIFGIYGLGIKPIMKKIAFLCLIFFFNLKLIFAQNLHVFSIIQTSDTSRPDRVLDADRLNDMSTDIASLAGFSKYYYDFGDASTFSPSYIRQTLQKLRFAPCNQDVVWVHYSGYGRNDEETIYPALKIGESEMYLRDIIGILRQKKPKIILLTVDSGNERKEVKEFSNQVSDMDKTPISVNNVSGQRIVKPIVSNPIPKEVARYNKIENYNRLFKDFEGTKVLIFMSNSEGENAISNVLDGAFGLNSFEKVINETINSKEKQASWQSIKEDYIRVVKIKSKNRQTPKVTIEVPLDKCKDDE